MINGYLKYYDSTKFPDKFSYLYILCESSHEIINNSRKVVVIKFYSFTFYSVLNLSINDLGL